MGMRHFDVQLIGGMVLHGGSIAEMKTGEGKTLTATLAVVLNSLAVRADHRDAVTQGRARRHGQRLPGAPRRGMDEADLRRARRDRRRAQNMQPATRSSAPTRATSRTAPTPSSASTTCATTWRRTSRTRSRRGHYFAIVDEVDNILIDEARTPLIISGAPEQAAELYVQFARLAPQDGPGKTPEGHRPAHARRTSSPTSTTSSTRSTRRVSVTEVGVAKAERFLGIDHLYRAENGHLVNHLIQCAEGRVALQARRRLPGRRRRGEDHRRVHRPHPRGPALVGGAAPGDRGQGGRARPGGEPDARDDHLQNYFRLYDKLAGMTGTALTEATEFMKIYKLPVVQVPTNRPMVRDDRNDQVYKTREGKWSAVGERDRRAPRDRPAGARRHDLRRGLRAALRPAAPARDRARGAQRQARVRRARGRDDRRGRAARRRHDRHEHGRPRRRHQARRQPRAPRPPGAREAGLRPATRTTRSASPSCCRSSSGEWRETASACSTPAGCTSSAPSATSRGASTTSCAAAPAARATRARAASSSPPRTI